MSATLTRDDLRLVTATIAHGMRREQDAWRHQRRPEQTPPAADWLVWLFMGGRGAGKTRTGAEWTIASARDFALVNIIGPTADDARDIMIEGEALALDTPIPTPDGWRVMDDLAVGDLVYDEHGQPCRVMWTSLVAEGRPCYRVGFSDGEEIVADAAHKWLTHTRSARQYGKPGSVVTTEDIRATLKKHGWNNHAIPLAGPVETPWETLPLDPYVLGAWLGDGRNRSGDFTSEDDRIPALIRDCGYTVSKHAAACAYRIRGIDPALRDLGVIGNKHIPSLYLHASIEQRLALLQGLMDTDGYISARGQCAFDGNNLRLVSDVRDLVRSLGMSCRTVGPKQTHRQFPGAPPMVRITFTPTLTVFRLDRKATRVRPLSKKASWRMVVAVESCPSTPVKCIAVNTETHLYLAGRGFVPTHNSGILAKSPRGFRPIYLPSKRRLEWPNGAKSLIFTADEPERLRGKQHMRLWGDEAGSWRYYEAYDQAMFGLRLGDDPRVLFTATPRPTRIIRELLDPARRDVAVTRATTYANAANLATDYVDRIIARYEGTRLGRQELLGELLTDTPGALWTLAMLDAQRLPADAVLPTMRRIVVAVDPAATHGEDADETGIVVCGLDAMGHGYVLEDVSGRYSPDEWARVAIAALDRWQADRIIAERNNGGEMVEYTLRTVRRNVPITTIHASRGKAVRAEPVAALFEQAKVSIVGSLPALEDQLTSFVPGIGAGHDDRLDSCLVAGTMISTSAGSRPIEDICVGDIVQTRQGWNRVTAAGMTSSSAATRTVILSSGEQLTGTPNHPVWIDGRGFASLDTLVYGDILYACQQYKKPRPGESILIASDRRHQRGIGPHGAEHGTENMPAVFRRGVSRNTRQYVSSVANRMHRIVSRGQRIVDFAAARVIRHPLGAMVFIGLKLPALFVGMRSPRASTNKPQKRVPVSVVRSYESGSAPVYNLTVETVPEYFANGILVHNCVYALTDLMLGAPATVTTGNYLAATDNDDDTDEYDGRWTHA